MDWFRWLAVVKNKYSKISKTKMHRGERKLQTEAYVRWQNNSTKESLWKKKNNTQENLELF